MSTTLTTKTGQLDIYSEAFDEVIEAIRADYDWRNKKGVRQHPWTGVQILKDFRFGAITLPKELGGAGASIEELFTAVIRVAEADPELAHIFRAHFMTVEFLLRNKTPHREHFLKEIRQGAIIGNAYTENSKHQAGGGKYDTHLVKEGDGYILQGEKAFTTGTYYADFTEVTAMLGDAPVNVIIPVKRDGVTVRDDWDGFGQKMTGSGTTSFDRVRVSAEEIFDSNDKNNTYAPIPHLYLQGIIAGILNRIVTDAVELIGKRKRSFSHGNTTDLKQDPQLQQVVGELSSYAFAAESIVLTAARSIDTSRADYNNAEADHTAALNGSQVKVAIEKLALEAASLLFEVGSASATKQSANLDRHWRNIRTLASHNPTLYKSRLIGNYHINGESLPTTAYF